MPSNTLAECFANEDAARQRGLDTARECAALVKPWLLPKRGHTPDTDLPENYQSVGSMGLTNLEGKLLTAIVPVDQPLVELELDPAVKYDPAVSDEHKQAFDNAFFMRELLIQSLLESSGLNQRGNRRLCGFRTNQRMSISMLLATGDALEQVTDDYRTKNFRRDQYVIKRDSAGDLLHGIVRESKDLAALDDKTLESLDLSKEDLREKNYDDAERFDNLYTRFRWEPWSKKWLLTQELREKVILETEEPVNPFISTAFELVPGENYGRGWIELNRGDLHSLNQMELRRLQLLALMSKGLLAKDINSLVDDEDLAKESGGIVHNCRVANGRASDIGVIAFEFAREIATISAAINDKSRQLARAMLLEGENQPRGDRVTAFQVNRLAMEIDGLLGGIYAPIAEQKQLPIFERVNHLIEVQKLGPVIPKGAYKLRALTGLVALNRATAQNRLLTYVQVAAQLGPEALRRIDTGVVMRVVARYQSLYEPGLTKSDEQLVQEQRAAEQAAARQQAVSKGIEVLGDASKAALAPQNNPSPLQLA